MWRQFYSKHELSCSQLIQTILKVLGDYTYPCGDKHNLNLGKMVKEVKVQDNFCRGHIKQFCMS